MSHTLTPLTSSWSIHVQGTDACVQNSHWICSLSKFMFSSEICGQWVSCVSWHKHKEAQNQYWLITTSDFLSIFGKQQLFVSSWLVIVNAVQKARHFTKLSSKCSLFLLSYTVSHFCPNLYSNVVFWTIVEYCIACYFLQKMNQFSCRPISVICKLHWITIKK